jgi:fructosamine-3-kinase
MMEEPACPESLALRKRIKGGRTNRCYRGVYRSQQEDENEQEAVVFAKFNDNYQDSLLRKEADMLELLRSLHVQVPRVLHVSDHCLILEYLQMENANKHIPMLARVVGSMHQATASDRCGFGMNNFHGPLSVNNTWDTNWVTFFRNSRWKALCDELARRGGLQDTLGLASQVSAKLDLFFPTTPRLCLLHGDLHHSNWGYCGNSVTTTTTTTTEAGAGGSRERDKESEGVVYLFDPLPLYGHNEFDLASLDCFVQPKESFLEIYYSYMPKDEVMFEERRMLYHSFFRIIGFLLTGDEEHLVKAHGYMTALIAVV